MEAGQRIPVGDTSQQARPVNFGEKTVGSPVLPMGGNRMNFVPRSQMSSQGGGNEKEKKESFTTRLLDGVVTLSLVAIFFGIPVFYTGITLQGLAFEKELYFYFWLLLGLVSWVSKGVILGEMKIRKTPLDAPILIFLAVYVASAAFSIDRWHSFWGSFGDPSRGALNVLALVAAYYLIMSHFNPRRFYLMLSSLVASAFVVIVWSLLAIFGVHFLPSSLEQSAPLSLLGSLNALMIFLGGMLPVFVVAVSKVQSLADRGPIFKRSLTTLLLVCLALDLFLLFALFPYVSWIAVTVGFAFFLIYILAQVVKMEEQWTWLPMLVLVIMLAFYMVGPIQFLKTNLPLEATPNMKLSWEVAKSALKDSLFLGSGPATYSYDFSLYRPQEYNLQPLNALRFNQGTGLLFEALPTLGIIGIIAFSLLLLSFVSVGLYLLSQKKEHNKIFSLGLWGMVVIFLIAGFLSQMNGTMVVLGVLVSTLALAVLMWEGRSEEAYLHLSLQSSPKFALALAFVFLVVSAGVAFTFAFIGKAFWADVMAARAMKAPVGTMEGVERMTSAVRIMPKESRYRSYLGQIYITLANQEAAKSEKDRNLDALKKYMEAGSGFVKVAQDQSPNDIVAQEVLAQAYESTLFITGVRADLLDGTQKAYERASALEPHNPIFYLKLGQVKKTLANSAKDEEQKTLLSEAKDLFQKSLDEQGTFVPGYLNLALAQEALGDADGAITNLARGISIGKDNKDVAELKYNLARLLRIRGGDDDLKLAEILLKDILAANDKSLNTHLNLGLVYEKMDRRDDAIKSYQNIMDLLKDGDGVDAARKQVQVLIDTVRAGKKNELEKAEAATAGQETSVTGAPVENVPPVAAPTPDTSIQETIPAP